MFSTALRSLWQRPIPVGGHYRLIDLLRVSRPSACCFGIIKAFICRSPPSMERYCR